MSDLPVLPAVPPSESIPAVLAAPKPKKLKPVRAAAEPFVPTTATFPDVTAAPFVDPTAAAPAEPFTPSITQEPTMATTIENVVENTADKMKNGAQAFSADMNTRAKDAMEKGTKFFAEMNGFTKGNVEALVESGKIAVAGVQSMAQDQAAYARRQFETATAAARELAGVKSPTEFVKLQGDLARRQFDGMVAEASRSTEAMLKLAGEVVQPISNRVAVAVERIKMAA